ncbi:o-methyltransferase like protein [Zymoseptoria brevis]|uniref:O-methyltransferase like protein n=1 Tax=Zymoseptoria brevis TaxID=1047168 RepID=A0A0F4GKL6_9PEZI|nr:o-methyltransferase like protein [Zymoseptoria brevis]
MSAPQPTTLVELAQRLLDYAKQIEAAIPSPTFQKDTMLDLPLDLRAIRNAAISASDEFNDLVRGSRGNDSRMDKYSGNTALAGRLAWHFVNHFRIPQAVPLEAGSRISYEELAEKTGLHVDDLTQILRYATTIHLFDEPSAGYVSHSADSRNLATTPSMCDYVSLMTGFHAVANVRYVDACQKWPGSQELNETSFNLAMGTDKPMFQWIEGHPTWPQTFGGAMVERSCGVSDTAGTAALSYPWDQLGENCKVVDVGGGNGHICMAIARKQPGIRFVVQDLPEVCHQASQALPKDLQDRITFMPHSYLDPQPVKDADAYFFSMIFHDQSDKYVKITLQHLTAALKPGARVLWCDRYVPEQIGSSDLSRVELQATLGTSLAMKSLLNGRERTLSEKKALFQAADARFKFLAEHKATSGNSFTVVEAIWQPDAEQ